jgi:hypothetical protein
LPTDHQQGAGLELVAHERICYTNRFDDANLPGEMRTSIALMLVEAVVPD